MQCQLTAGNTRYIEQVVEEHSHVRCLPVNDIQPPTTLSTGRGVRARHFHSLSYRSQRISQFMGQCCKEFVLALIRKLECFSGTDTLGHIQTDANHACRYAPFVDQWTTVR